MPIVSVYAPPRVVSMSKASSESWASSHRVKALDEVWTHNGVAGGFVYTLCGWRLQVFFVGSDPLDTDTKPCQNCEGVMRGPRPFLEDVVMSVVAFRPRPEAEAVPAAAGTL